ncbi:hypothetical protein GJ496_009665 [Pomphorhynchus laevis]|nr:hypothetical protein GJ496_009665 [Pomphorhynchus laevis]
MAKKNYDILFKLLLIGDSGVGKTCILHRYTDDDFSDSLLATIGIDFKMKTVEMRNKKIRLQIWDTAGQERFHTITNSYYRGAMGIILVYDITNEKSFDNIVTWLANINEHARPNVVRLLVGNKVDQAEYRTVEYERAINLANESHMKFFETSAKDGTNIRQMFHAITEQVLDNNPAEFSGHEDDRRRQTASDTNQRTQPCILLHQNPSGINNSNDTKNPFSRCNTGVGSCYSSL